MTETTAKPEGRTPGQVLHESLRESAPAAFGYPIGGFATWEQIPQLQRDRLENAARDVTVIERKRIKGLFDQWITITMSEPNAHPPEAWIAAFADLIRDKPQFKLSESDPEAREEAEFLADAATLDTDFRDDR